MGGVGCSLALSLALRVARVARRAARRVAAVVVEVGVRRTARPFVPRPHRPRRHRRCAAADADAENSIRWACLRRSERRRSAAAGSPRHVRLCRARRRRQCRGRDERPECTRERAPASPSCCARAPRRKTAAAAEAATTWRSFEPPASSEMFSSRVQTARSASRSSLSLLPPHRGRSARALARRPTHRSPRAPRPRRATCPPWALWGSAGRSATRRGAAGAARTRTALR